MAQPNLPADTKPEDMSGEVGHAITLAAFFVPLLLVMILGLAVGNSNTAFGFAIIWSGVFIGATLRFVRKRTFFVVERFGYFWRVKYAGPRVFIPWIDNVIMRDDFLQKSVELYQGEDQEIDFADASTPIHAAAWYQIGNPEDIEIGDFDAVTEQVQKYTYRVRAEERQSRVAEIFQSVFRVFLESKRLTEAQAEMENLAQSAIDGGTAVLGGPPILGARVALAEIGVYPFPGKGIMVRDIDLPQEISNYRSQQMRGQAEAQERVNRSRAYWEPLTQMKEGLDQGGMHLTDEQVLQLFMTQRGLETVQATGANISFVSPDMDAVLKTITVGAAGTQRNPPVVNPPAPQPQGANP